MNTESVQTITEFVESRPATASGTGEALISIRQQSTEWFEKSVSRLHELYRLKRNWDGYGANPVNEISIHYAHLFLSLINSIEGVGQPNITATPNGFVGFSWDDRIMTLEVEIDDSGHYCYYYELKDGSIEEEDRTTDSRKIIDLVTRF